MCNKHFFNRSFAFNVNALKSVRLNARLSHIFTSTNLTLFAERLDTHTKSYFECLDIHLIVLIVPNYKWKVWKR